MTTLSKPTHPEEVIQLLRDLTQSDLREGAFETRSEMVVDPDTLVPYLVILKHHVRMKVHTGRTLEETEQFEEVALTFNWD